MRGHLPSHFQNRGCTSGSLCLELLLQSLDVAAAAKGRFFLIRAVHAEEVDDARAFFCARQGSVGADAEDLRSDLNASQRLYARKVPFSDSAYLTFFFTGFKTSAVTVKAKKLPPDIAPPAVRLVSVQ